MAYQIMEILQKCDHDDADFFINLINSYINFTDDKGLNELREVWQQNDLMPAVLAKKIEREIRYLGSNDIAYAYRKLRGIDPAGIDMNELIDDVSKAMKINRINIKDIKFKLEFFCKAIVDKTFNDLDTSKQIDILSRLNISKDNIDSILYEINNYRDRSSILVLLSSILGKKVTSNIFENFIAYIVNLFISNNQKNIFDLMMKKINPATTLISPLYLTSLAPVPLISEILGPAYRKTIPLILYLGLICIRSDKSDEIWKVEY